MVRRGMNDYATGSIVPSLLRLFADEKFLFISRGEAREDLFEINSAYFSLDIYIFFLIWGNVGELFNSRMIFHRRDNFSFDYNSVIIRLTFM